MCKGPIVAPPGKKMVEAKSGFSLTEVFKRFWDRIICSDVHLDHSEVNMCLKCGDLEIGGEWQRIPHPQKPIISKEIESGGITINGSLVMCDFCASMEKEIKDKRNNLYTDQQANMEIFPVSSASF